MRINMIRELALKNRSYRRFYGEKKIDEKTLRELVDIARNTPSAANRQPLQYRLVCDDETNSRVYDCLGWAGYYKDWDGPVAEERPSAYIIMVTPQDVNPQWDEGLAGQTILLAATEMGLGGCMIGNFGAGSVKEALSLPEYLSPMLIVAIGKPAETVVLEEVEDGESIAYYRDEQDVHHVPKRKLADVVLDRSMLRQQ